MLGLGPTRNSYGALLRTLGKYEAALERADAVYRRRFGPEHTSVAINRTALGMVSLDRGDLVEAEDRFRAALEIFEAALPPEDHRDVLDARAQLHRYPAPLPPRAWMSPPGRTPSTSCPGTGTG